MTYGHSLVRVFSLSILAAAAQAGASQTGGATPSAGLGSASGGGPNANTALAGGLEWTFSSGTEGWMPTVIALGNGGTEVFSEVGPFNPYTRFFSSFDASPPVPVWQTLSPVTAFHQSVDSAETCDVHAGLYDVYADQALTTRTVYVKRLSASTPANDWTYTFPFVTNGHDNLGVKISRDGTRIVAAVYNIWTSLTQVAVFDSSSGIPIAYLPIATGGPCTTMLLSGDGTRLYLASGSRITLLDIPSGAVLNTTYLFDTTFPAGHAISGDGSMFAYGTYNAVKVFKRSPTTGLYSLAFTHSVPGQNYCDELAISNDGSMLACAFEFFDHFLTVQIDAVDVASTATTMSNTVTGSGSYENVASAMSISSDGRRFAVGLWGDQALSVPQVEFYDSHQSAPIGAYFLPGSVNALSMSGDGTHVAVASKSTHANVSGQGGSIELYQAGSMDFRLQGVPHAGGSVSFQMSGNPGAHARLLFSPNAAAQPALFPGVGTLYLDRPTTQSLSMGTVGPNGFAQTSFAVPTTIGATWYFQGFCTAPRTLSHDWVRMTVMLP
jgi:hypothetical protein